ERPDSQVSHRRRLARAPTRAAARPGRGRRFATAAHHDHEQPLDTPLPGPARSGAPPRGAPRPVRGPRPDGRPRPAPGRNRPSRGDRGRAPAPPGRRHLPQARRARQPGARDRGRRRRRRPLSQRGGARLDRGVRGAPRPGGRAPASRDRAAPGPLQGRPPPLAPGAGHGHPGRRRRRDGLDGHRGDPRAPGAGRRPARLRDPGRASRQGRRPPRHGGRARRARDAGGVLGGRRVLRGLPAGVRRRGRRAARARAGRAARGAGAAGARVAAVDAAGSHRRRSRPMSPDVESRGSLLTLFLCGDVMTGRGVDQVLPHPSDPRIHEDYTKDAREYVRLAARANGPIPAPVDFAWIWGDALAELERARPDARIVNLETSVTRSDGYWRGKGIHYRMHPDNVPCILAARIDCCVLANNHVLDYGHRGLVETLETLARAGVRTAGAGRSLEEAARPAVIDVPGKGRVVVFGFGTETSGIPPAWAATGERPGVNFIDLSDATVGRIRRAIRRIKRPRDVVVASIHWGGNWG